MTQPGFHVGDHYLVELNDCQVESLNSEERLRKGLLRAVEKSGARIIQDVFHAFSPHGVTGVIVIAESHVSIHTWPEHAYAAVDIFTCSQLMKVQVILDELREITGAKTINSTRVSRGPQHLRPTQRS